MDDTLVERQKKAKMLGCELRSLVGMMKMVGEFEDLGEEERTILRDVAQRLDAIELTARDFA